MNQSLISQPADSLSPESLIKSKKKVCGERVQQQLMWQKEKNNQCQLNSQHPEHQIIRRRSLFDNFTSEAAQRWY